MLFKENPTLLFKIVYLSVGFGSGMVYAPSIIIIGYYFEKYRAMATGIGVCGSSVGVLVLSSGLAVFLDKYGWRWCMRLEAVLVMLTCFLALFFSEVEPTLVEVNLDENAVFEPVPIERAKLGSPSLAMSHAEYITRKHFVFYLKYFYNHLYHRISEY